MLEINEFEKLIQPKLKEDGFTLVRYSTKRFTAPGENYGSLMLGVDVRIKDSDGKEKDLHLVAKKIPENEWLREMFKVQETFVKEMRFYDTIVPTLRTFQLKQNMEKVVDFFPRYFGGRISLNPELDKVDENGVLLFENLKPEGYKNWDRFTGFDLDMTKFILNDLAVFHAVPIALKIKSPGIFQRKILANTKFTRLFDQDDEEFENKMHEQLTSAINESMETAPFTERVFKSMKHAKKVTGTPYNGLFATISHNDYWVNNTMLKFEGNKVVDNKMVDFQVVDYGSLGKDIVFFLFTSVQDDLITKHYDELIKLYFNKFLDTLKQLGCNLEKFTHEAFEKELDRCAKDGEILHCIHMTRPILTPSEDAKELKDLKPHDIGERQMTQRQKEKIQFLVKEFAKRKWI